MIFCVSGYYELDLVVCPSCCTFLHAKAASPLRHAQFIQTLEYRYSYVYYCHVANIVVAKDLLSNALVFHSEVASMSETMRLQVARSVGGRSWSTVWTVLALLALQTFPASAEVMGRLVSPGSRKHSRRLLQGKFIYFSTN